MYRRILKMYGLVTLLGALVGVFGSCFQLSIRVISHWLSMLYQAIHYTGFPVSIIAVIVSMSMVFVAWLLVQYIAPEAHGSGVPEIEGALLHQRPIFWRRLLPVKFIGGILSISANMVLGREGPTIQIGGNLGEMLGEWASIKRHRRDTLISAGAAAGLATAFNAPLAGVLLVIEEMRRPFRFSFTNFSIVAICCVSATIVENLLIGSQAVIKMDVFALPSLHSLIWFLLLGIVIGVVGYLFNNVLMQSLNRFDKLSIQMKWLFVLMVGGLIGYLTIIYPSVVGGGYDIIEQALVMRPSFLMILCLLVIRFVLGMLCYSTGVPGGIFAPMLALGALIGLACSYVLKWSIDPSIHPGMFAVAGMGALFSAAVRAPLTGIVLVVEMTRNYFLILPLMVTCLTATTIEQLFGDPPIYSQLLHRAEKKEIT
jgi:CIC family chloride channel protein